MGIGGVLGFFFVFGGSDVSIKIPISLILFVTNICSGLYKFKKAVGDDLGGRKHISKGGRTLGYRICGVV